MNTLERTLTSNEVAKMIGTTNGELMKSIRTYISHLADGNIPSGDFFIASTYKDANNQERANYLLTKKGCEMVSNKITGAKGTQFTAKYVSRFNDMESHIKQEVDASHLSPELQMFQGIFQAVAKQELATKKLESKIDNISEIVGVNSTNWREDSNRLINKIVRLQGNTGQAHQEVRSMVFLEVDKRAGVSLQTRLTNKRRRMADEGASKSRRDKLTKVDVIADDKKLIEIYVAVVKEYAIKYNVWNNDF